MPELNRFVHDFAARLVRLLTVKRFGHVVNWTFIAVWGRALNVALYTIDSATLAIEFEDSATLAIEFERM